MGYFENCVPRLVAETILYLYIISQCLGAYSNIGALEHWAHACWTWMNNKWSNRERNTFISRTLKKSIIPSSPTTNSPILISDPRRFCVENPLSNQPCVCNHVTMSSLFSISLLFFSFFRAFVRILCVCCPRKVRRKYQPAMRSKSQVIEHELCTDSAHGEHYSNLVAMCVFDYSTMILTDGHLIEFARPQIRHIYRAQCCCTGDKSLSCFQQEHERIH